jgi:glycosyltransferase involved in cell wall biosynthesis
VLLEGDTGLGVDVADAAGTALAILTLLRNEGLRRRMGDRARALVQERFSESAAVDRLLAIYERVSKR